ncbi:hypothetical protein JVU11DRAFT_3945 [Chiua virens]|nr:hypothetical protein JVU11DRAFT_3945 [Chiua virens]
MPFSDLLTFDRFAGLIKKQAKAFFGHPLFFEIVEVAGIVHARRAWLGALRWIESKDKPLNKNDKVTAVTDLPVAVAHGGSSPSNIDVFVTIAPETAVENGPIQFCMRPGELYFGATNLGGRMNMNLYYDRNVFEDGVVKEWSDEVKAAVLSYLEFQPIASCSAG